METETVGPDLEGAMLRTVLEAVSSGQDGVTPGAVVEAAAARTTRAMRMLKRVAFAERV